MTRRSRRAWLALVLLAGACARGYISSAGPEHPARVIATLDEALAREIAAAANRARAAEAVAGLAEDSLLAAAARDYAVELARRDQLTHTSQRSGYATLQERIAHAGAKLRGMAENLAVIGNRGDVAAEVVRLWLHSRAHRDSLLSPRYSLVGTGVAAGAGNRWYVVQVYGAP